MPNRRLTEEVVTSKKLHPRGIRFRTAVWSLVVGIVVTAAACAYLIATGASSNPDKIAVRRWLTENLDTPEWTEIRWWNGVDIRTDNSEILDIYKSGRKGETPPPYHEDVARVIRLKIRTKNKFGATELRDICYFVDPDSREVIDHEDWALLSAKARYPFWQYLMTFESLYKEPDSDFKQTRDTQSGWASMLGDMAEGEHSGKARDRKTPAKSP